jgi:hypothetical protein
VGRINMFWGFAWKAIPRYFGDSPRPPQKAIY